MPLPPVIGTWLDRAVSALIGVGGTLLVQWWMRRADRPRLQIDVGQIHYQGRGHGASLPGVALAEGPYVLADTTLNHYGGMETTICLVQMRFRAGRWRAKAHRTLWTTPLPKLVTPGDKVRGTVYGEIRKLPLPPEVKYLHVWLTFRHASGRARTDFIVEVPPESWKR